MFILLLQIDNFNFLESKKFRIDFFLKIVSLFIYNEFHVTRGKSLPVIIDLCKLFDGFWNHVCFGIFSFISSEWFIPVICDLQLLQYGRMVMYLCLA